MFKFNLPMTIILSSGSLMLLAIGSLLLVSNTVYTSDITIQQSTSQQIEPNHQQQQQNNIDYQNHQTNSIAKSDESRKSEISTSQPSAKIEVTDLHHLQDQAAQQVKVSVASSATNNDNNNLNSARRRNGRLYGGSGQSGASSPSSSSSLDSYAAAYAAANSLPTSAEHQSSVQTTIQANDAINYASFGESPSVTGGSSSLAGSLRQINSQSPGNGADYAPPLPAHSSNYYMSPSASNYQGQYSGNFHSSPSSSPGYYQKSPSSVGYLSGGGGGGGYERPAAMSYYNDRSASYQMPSHSTPFWSSSDSAGLMSSASSALSTWTKGFTITEIVCSLVAISIGAIILGAPFFLIYLALMGNFSGSGSLSLTNPTQATPATAAGGASTTVNGRRKRLAIFEQFNYPSPNNNHHHQQQQQQQQRILMNDFGVMADSFVSQLSPFVDLHQVSTTFKRLVNALEKYSDMKHEEQGSNNNNYNNNNKKKHV